MNCDIAALLGLNGTILSIVHMLTRPILYLIHSITELFMSKVRRYQRCNQKK